MSDPLSEFSAGDIVANDFNGTDPCEVVVPVNPYGGLWLKVNFERENVDSDLLWRGTDGSKERKVTTQTDLLAIAFAAQKLEDHGFAVSHNHGVFSYLSDFAGPE